MAWKDIPEIRDLEPYCKKFGYQYIVAFAVNEDLKSYTIVTYGKTKALCKIAALCGDDLKKMVDSEEWPTWPEGAPGKFPGSISRGKKPKG